MTTLNRAIENFLDQGKFNYQYDEKQDVFFMQLSLRDTQLDCIIVCDEDDESVRCLIVLPVILPRESYPALLHKINEINASFDLATLYLAPTLGHVIAKSVVRTFGEPLREKQMMHLVAMAMAGIESNRTALFEAAFESAETRDPFISDVFSSTGRES